MCDLPSWYEFPDKSICFLTDKDVDELPETLLRENLPGHEAIRAVYKNVLERGGVQREGFPCHPEIAAAINAGQMQKMIATRGWKSAKIDKPGNVVSIIGLSTVDASGCTALTSLDAKAAEYVDTSGCLMLKRK